jgi:serralysin
MASATDDPDRDAAALVFSRAKGGLYSGPDTTGLDPNVVAQLMGYRWTTSFGGSQPATTITYAFHPGRAQDVVVGIHANGDGFFFT